MSVVTVDDQQVFLSAAREVIEATPGFRSVGEASCGEEALGLVDEQKPELVLVDVRMRGMDGIETARRIKQAHPEVVVVLISIEDPANVPAGAADSGAVALVRKQDFGSRMLRGLWTDHGTPRVTPSPAPGERSAAIDLALDEEDPTPVGRYLWDMLRGLFVRVRPGRRP